MTRRSTRLFASLAVVAALTGCAEIDCREPRAYHRARLSQPIETPEGLEPPARSGTYAIPGTPPGEGYTEGACLARPPRVIPAPVEEG